MREISSWYDGFVNFETWAVNEGLRNDEGRYEHWQEQAEAAEMQWGTESETGVPCGAAFKRAAVGLAVRIREAVQTSAHEPQATCFSHLLDAALPKVAWLEIAEHLILEREPVEDCWPRATLEPDQSDEEKAALAAIKHERRARQGGPLFDLGKSVTRPKALEVLLCDDILKALSRHANGDWGDVCREDWEENELSLREGLRLFSVYHAASGVKFYVITEADRSVTTVLLPREY